MITQDLHIHTYLSPCANATATVEYYVTAARRLGLDTIALTDHMWDPAVSRAYGGSGWYDTYGLSPALVGSIRRDAETAEHAGIRILLGCETEYDRERHLPAISVEAAAAMDVVLAPNSHTHCTMPKELYYPMERHAEYMLRAFWDIVESPVAPYITAIPHPFSAVCSPYDNRLLLPLLSESQYGACFAAAAERGIAMELNASCLSAREDLANDPMLWVLGLAKRADCKFTFGSDAHNNRAHDRWGVLRRAAILLGLTPEDILYL